MGACGSPTRAQQAATGRQLAEAVRQAQQGGVRVTLEESLALNGGSLAAGQEYRLQASGSGLARGDQARFSYAIDQGSQRATYQMMFDASRLYVEHAPSSGWKSVPLESMTSLFPALRLTLIRQSLLLASSISSPQLIHLNSGFARSYAIQPGPDQVQQLQSIAVDPSIEAAFLKQAQTQIDVDLSLPGDRLLQIQVHLAATDPVSGQHQEILSTASFSPARVGDLSPPGGDVATSPGEILA
ncbi:MAG TPA: hypothetical protein VNI34_03740 [Candidatus Nitrosotalea sp.]|nr:hypothetical protein [Candidatus Nitrosotalea sp.]